MRSKGDNSITPDSCKFKSAVRGIMSCQLLTPSEKGNCEIEVSDFTKKEIEESSFRICSDYPATENSFAETAELEEDNHDQYMIPDNALTYVTGWACSRIPHETCKLELASFKSENLTAFYQHIANKKYDSANFLIPTSYSVPLSKIIRSTFHTHFRKILSSSRQGVKTKLMSLIFEEID